MSIVQFGLKHWNNNTNLLHPTKKRVEEKFFQYIKPFQ